MRRIGHTISCLATILALLVGGVLDGLAQAAPLPDSAGLSRIVICADGREATITIDAKGDPVRSPGTGHSRHCPDCLQAPAVDLPVAARMPVPAGPAGRIVALCFPSQASMCCGLPHRARAPPSEV